MSIQAVAWALDQDLPARPKLVLVSIANHANHTDGYCWLKAETIAAEAACKPRSVYRFVADLIRNGYVRKALRRGEDGKQRANDYWILLDRPPTPWVSVPGADVQEDAELHGSEGDEPQDVEGAEEVTAEPGDGHDTRQEPVEKHALSPGPGDSGVSHIDSAEPSKTKPENARARATVPRGYVRPPMPPPQPKGATTGDGSIAPIFVYWPSDAYDAWAARIESERRAKGDHRPFKLKTTRDGRWGWYFPRLFPPPLADAPKAGEQRSDIDNPFDKTG